MTNAGKWRVQVGKTKRTGEIDRIQDHKRLRAGAFTRVPCTSDLAYRPDPGEMQGALSQEQTRIIEIWFTADKNLDAVFQRTPRARAG